MKACSSSELPESNTKHSKQRVSDTIEKALDGGLTRLGSLGELGLVVLLVLTVLYLFAFSHRNSQFSQPIQVQGQAWAQPRSEARNWIHQHTMYATKAAADEAELLLFGDSVIELLRGTVHMEPDPRSIGIPEVYHTYLGQKYKAAVFGISGDTTSHLMWRIENGEAPAGLHAAKAVVVLIGANDLTYASFQGDEYIPPAGNTTVRRIAAIVNRVKSSIPQAEVLLLGLLPRGDQTLMPEPTMFLQPSKFTQTIEVVNKELQAFAASQSYVTFLECGPGFINNESMAIHKELMPDALHPNAAGMEVLMKCMLQSLPGLLGHK